METAQAKPEMPKAEIKRRRRMLQARFDALELEARQRLRKALGAGQHRLTALDEALAKVTKEDWSVDGVRKRFDLLRTRAEELRATALKRVSEIPGTAVSALANGTRVPVQNLARELERLAKLVEPAVEVVKKDVEAVAAAAKKEVDVLAAAVEKPARAVKQKIEA